MSLLQVRALKTWLPSAAGAVRAVDEVGFQVDRGETFALLGESGCGKSMTALSLMRLLPDGARIRSGQVILNGRDLLALSEAQMRDVRGREMAMIFQEPASSLNPVLTIGRQIAEVLECHSPLRGAAQRDRLVELLDAVGIADAAQRLADYPFQFSGGMRQRVMIAMALAADPHLLIADEPTTALDVTIQAQVLALLRRVQQARGMGMLLITHDLGIVAQMADRVGVMYAGELVEVADRADFFADPAHPYSRKLLAAVPRPELRAAQLETISGSVPVLTTAFTGCRFAPRCPQAWSRCHEAAPDWHSPRPGQQVRCHLYDPAENRARPASTHPSGRTTAEASREPGAQAQPLLVVSELKVHFPIRGGLLRRVTGQIRAVDGVSLALTSGQTLALVGESGCGKTTVGKAILKLLPTSGGAVRYRGQDLATLNGRQMRALRREMQIVFQDPYASLNPRMSVGDIIEEGMSVLDSTPPAQRAGRVIELLERVGLSAQMRERYPHEFSGGQRQRIAIARALAVSPRLLICDEPTSALDVSVQAQILNLLRTLQAELGLAYLFITHNIAVVDHLAHHVAVMYLGRIVEQGTVDEVLRNPQHPYTVALLSAVPRIEADGAQNASARNAPVQLAGDLPSVAHPPRGCHFRSRCPQAMARCAAAYPDEIALSPTHRVRCFLHEPLEADSPSNGKAP